LCYSAIANESTSHSGHVVMVGFCCCLCCEVCSNGDIIIIVTIYPHRHYHQHGQPNIIITPTVIRPSTHIPIPIHYQSPIATSSSSNDSHPYIPCLNSTVSILLPAFLACRMPLPSR